MTRGRFHKQSKQGLYQKFILDFAMNFSHPASRLKFEPERLGS